MNRLHTLFAHKKHPLRLRLLCTGLCCAFLFAGGYYAARHLLNAYWPSLGAAFADNGLTLRAFCAAAAAVLPASLLAYAFYYTAQQHRHAYAVAQTLLAGCISGTAVACVATACFALGTLYSALLAIAGCLLGFAACLGIFYIWKNRKPGKLHKVLFSAPKTPFFCRQRPFCRAFARTVGFVCAVLLPCYCVLLIEAVHFPLATTTGYGSLTVFLHTRLRALLFALLIWYLLFTLLLLLLKKGWVAGGVLLLLSFAMMAVNYYKFSLTGDFFYPWDFVQTGNVSELLSFIKIAPAPRMILGSILGIGIVLCLALSRLSLPLRLPIRLPVFALLCTLPLLCIRSPKASSALLQRFDLQFENMALQQSNYGANGFISGFFLNVLSMHITSPDNYTPEAVAQALQDCTATEASENFLAPDIILVLSESFWDPRLLPGTVFSENPLQNYDALCATPGTISGYMYESAFGGGTVRPEFEILTGLTTDILPSGSVPWQYITQKTPSMLQTYCDLGYRTIAVHPYVASFYDREQTYPLIGIQETYFQDALCAISSITPQYRGKQISDLSFVEYLQYYIDHSPAETPVFVFGISMENHQSYEYKFSASPYTTDNPDFDIYTENPKLQADAMEALGNYVQGLKDADRALGALAAYIDARDRPTVLIWYGDHLPTLGANKAAYVQSGLIQSPPTAQDQLTLHRTPFLIYANFPFEESSLVHAGSDNAISCYHLLNTAGELIGAPRSKLGAFLQAYAQQSAYDCAAIRSALPQTQLSQTYAQWHRLLSYDIIAGARYSLQN